MSRRTKLDLYGLMEPSSRKSAAAGALRAGCLNFTELSAISVANIGPTIVAALIVPLMYANAGNGSWLAYLFGTVMLLFVTLNLNQFARRSAATGSMHAYTVMGLGAAAGGISGWCLVWAYLFDGIAGVAGFAIFGNALLGMLGVHVPNILMFAILCGVIWFLAYEDIQISSLVMLLLEALSIAMILILCALVLSRHKFALDTAQLHLKGASLSGIAMGVNIAVFSLVGFENATAFGEEAKDPLVTIPRVLIVNLVLTGLFFVLVSYTEILGFVGYKTPLDKVDTPLNILAQIVGMPAMVVPLSLAVVVSCFSGGLACLNSGARILYSLSRHGILHSSVGAAHSVHETPHVAVTIMGAMLFAVPAAMLLVPGTQPFDVVGYAGTLTAFGFIGAYFLVSVAAPAYLKREGIVRGRDYALAGAAALLLLFPAVGSVYPVPAWPYRAFPYTFLAYVIVGLVWILFRLKGISEFAGGKLPPPVAQPEGDTLN
jgi:amino acid transporter